MTRQLIHSYRMLKSSLHGCFSCLFRRRQRCFILISSDFISLAEPVLFMMFAFVLSSSLLGFLLLHLSANSGHLKKRGFHGPTPYRDGLFLFKIVPAPLLQKTQGLGYALPSISEALPTAPNLSTH